PSRLEFTLRLGGLPRTIDVAADTTGQPLTEVVVTFTGLSAYQSDIWRFEIPVEDSVDTGSAKGMLLAWNWSEGTWLMVPTVEGPKMYGYYTPDLTTRRLFVLAVDPTASSPQQFVSSGGLMRLKLLHFGTAPFTARHDLVQVIPYIEPSGNTLTLY